jgi:hypothetical protein
MRDAAVSASAFASPIEEAAGGGGVICEWMW